MKQNIKPITKQLLIAAIILTLVTALSFGIRHVRFRTYQADSGQSTPSARLSDTEDQHQLDKSLNADAESDYYQADSYIADAEDDSHDTGESFWDEPTPSDYYSEEDKDPIKYDKAISKTKSFKDGYAKSAGKSGLQKISLSNNENIFITEKGEAWYVSKGSGGEITKMQVQVDDYSGRITGVGGGYYGKSEGSQGPRRIPMGDNEDIYLTDEGETWYVSEQPDGSTAKAQLEEDIDGELTIVDDGKDD